MPRQGEMYLHSRRPLYSASSSALPEAVSHTPARSACSNLSANRSTAVVIAPPARRCVHINVAQQDAPQSDQQPLSRLTPQVKRHVLINEIGRRPLLPPVRSTLRRNRGPMSTPVDNLSTGAAPPRWPRTTSRAAVRWPRAISTAALRWPRTTSTAAAGDQPAGLHVESRISRVTIPNGPTWRVLPGDSIRDALSVGRCRQRCAFCQIDTPN